MSVTYNTTLKNTRMTSVVTAIDNGGAGALVIGTTGMGTTLVSITFNATCGTVSAGVLTFSGTPLSGTASNSGTAAAAVINDGTATQVASGLTVGTSASDINFTSVGFTSGQTITITSATITHG